MFKFLFKNNLAKYTQTINEIKKNSSKYYLYSDKELEEEHLKLKKQIKLDDILDKILPKAFGLVTEEIRRTTGLILFDVQLLGAIILHEGKIAEMKTGEGKTMIAMLTAYLNCLLYKGVHIITVNDYLAKRDSELASKIFHNLNIKIGLIEPSMTNFERKKQYLCDITYLTNSELGFDYLRDNIAIDYKDIAQRDFYFAIIDEIDSILIDEARTPLIISGPSDNKNNQYIKSQNIANTLQINLDYDLDEKNKNIILNEKGINKCEQILNIDNLYNIKNPWIKFILNALKAKELFLENKDYIIKNNEIIIVDEFTGRIMEGRRWSDGLHQAIEAKENVSIQQENKTFASITYQNLFLLYDKLSGMTGTAKTEETELFNIYKLEVIEIPTNKLNQRKDLPDLVYKTEYGKWKAIADECLDMYKIGRPTLIGTTNIAKSELLAKILETLKIPYNLLNAKPENIARESEIITQAGRKYSITISTNMAGRGTDIILGGNPDILAKIRLCYHINNLLNLPNNYTLNNNEYQIQALIENITLDSIIGNKKIDPKNIEQSVNRIINTPEKLTNTKDSISRIYLQILHKYKEVCKKEKEEIIKMGGLYVIGTERHESRRIDNQLRGRSGRQGDKGSSRFFLSLQDNLLRIFGGDKIAELMQNLNIDETTPIESILLSKSLDSAQKKVEAYFYDVRKQLFEYDEVINNQRQAIYTERKRILQSNFTRDCIIEYAESTIEEMLIIYSQKTNNQLKKEILLQINQLLNLNNEIIFQDLKNMDLKNVKIFLLEQLRITYDLRESYLEQLRPGLIRKLEKYYLLQQIDYAWQEHLERMLLLKESIGWRSYGQQDPLIEYKNEAFNLFVNMVTYIRQTVIYLTMRSRLIINIEN
uniref:Protein translocase subunit SecA n=1 Tax=Antithamnion hubbsii TaxID=1005974 RepID=A0A4D6WQ33_9FLOR|nr:Preprotein-translocase subunit a [Antithamnion hubbsii]